MPPPLQLLPSTSVGLVDGGTGCGAGEGEAAPPGRNRLPCSMRLKDRPELATGDGGFTSMMLVGDPLTKFPAAASMDGVAWLLARCRAADEADG